MFTKTRDMNATELFLRDGTPANVWFCGKCHLVKVSSEQAEQCCEPYKCKYCGKESGRQYLMVCRPCEEENNLKTEAERFDKAEKVTSWDGWIFHEGTGNDGYSVSVQEFLEDWKDSAAEGDELPKYVWACKPNYFVRAQVGDIMERLADDAYDDFDEDDLNGLDDLKAAIERFNEANKGICSYAPDYKTAVLLEPIGRELKNEWVGV